MRTVAAVPAGGLLAGCVIGLLFPDVPIPCGVALLVACATAAVWARYASTSLALLLAVGGAFLIGGAMLSADAWRQAWRPSLRVAFQELAQRERAQAAAERRRLPEDDEAFGVIEGVLRTDAALTPRGVSLSIAAESIRGRPGATLQAPAAVAGGVQVTVVGVLAASLVDEWREGRRVRMPVQLRRPARYLDPDVPDFERALARRGTTLVGTVKSGALVEVVDRGSHLDEVTGAVRAFVRRAIGRAVGAWSERSAGIVAAIVIGDRAGLDDEVERRLQEAGTYHVIAISGGNIAVVAGLLLAAFRLGGVLGRTAMASAIVALIAYARLVGGGASVSRATFVAVVYFAARAFDHRGAPLNTLALAAGCLVLVRPLDVIDPGLVLTFGAALSILCLIPIVQGWHLPRRVMPVAGLLAASIAVEVMLLPVGALIFSRVTFAGLALNFAAIPLMSVAQLAGTALVPLTLISPGAALSVGAVAHLAAAGLIWTAELVRFASAVTFRVSHPPWLVVSIYYVAVVSAYVARRRPRGRAVSIALAVVAGLWIVGEPWALVARRGDGRLHVTFVDVGQGDATLVVLPAGRTLLVDAGGLSPTASFDVGDRVVAPVLRAAGIRRLDDLVLTHGDPDHVGGANAILREFRPATVWEGIPVPPFEPLRALRAQARATGSRWVNVNAGHVAQLDGVDVIVRHPRPPDWERQRVRNDDSVVLELKWRDVSVLLPGDIGTAVEHTLLSRVPDSPIRVVKAPHHGSQTSSSSEFIAALSPTVAVFSAGRGNHFGHPDPEVLRRYHDAGAAVFRTDQDGAVTVDTDGRQLRVQGFTGRSLAIP